jgi:hypothetical protein
VWKLKLGAAIRPQPYSHSGKRYGSFWETISSSGGWQVWKDPVLKTPFYNLEKSHASNYTPQVFGIVRKEFEKIDSAFFFSSMPSLQ